MGTDKLNKENVKKIREKLKKYEYKGNLKFVSPIPIEDLTDDFLKMLPSGTEIIYNEPIKDIEKYKNIKFTLKGGV